MLWVQRREVSPEAWKTALSHPHLQICSWSAACDSPDGHFLSVLVEGGSARSPKWACRDRGEASAEFLMFLGGIKLRANSTCHILINTPSCVRKVLLIRRLLHPAINWSKEQLWGITSNVSLHIQTNGGLISGGGGICTPNEKLGIQLLSDINPKAAQSASRILLKAWGGNCTAEPREGWKLLCLPINPCSFQLTREPPRFPPHKPEWKQCAAPSKQLMALSLLIWCRFELLLFRHPLEGSWLSVGAHSETMSVPACVPGELESWLLMEIASHVTTSCDS